MKKCEIRLCRNSEQSLPHVVTVEFMSKWNCWAINVNPSSARRIGKPIRAVECPNYAEAVAMADKIKAEVMASDS